MHRTVKAAALHLVPLVLFASLASSTSVNVGLRSKWSAPHLWLEMGEYIASENNTAYFSFIDAVTRKPPLSKRLSDLYTHALDVIVEESFLQGGKRRDTLALSLLELSTAMHFYAPRIESDYQYYQTEVLKRFSTIQDCELWLDWHGQQVCSIEQFKQLANLKQDPDNEDHWIIDQPSDTNYNLVDLKPNERVLSSSSVTDDKDTVVLYGNINSAQFNTFHQFLVDLTRYNPIQYALRWKPSSSDLSSNHPIWMTGYGVELALKSTEYLVMDDRDSNDTETATTDKAAEKDDIDSTLTNDMDAELLLDSVGDRKTPLKSTHLEGLGLKMIDFIITAKNPIKVLRKLVSDLPKYVPIIARRPVDSQLFNELGRAQALNMKPGHTSLLVNGISFNPTAGSIYQLLRLIRSEHTGVSQLLDLGLTPGQANSLLISAQRPVASAEKIAWLGDAYDVRDKVANGDAIFYLNDLETDSRYEDWPSQLFELLRPSRPGQLLRIARNLVTVILALDFSNPQTLVVVARDVLDVIQNNVPIRFAVIPIVGTDDQSADAKVAKLFYYFARVHKRKGAIKFLDQIIDEIENTNNPDVYAVAESLFDRINNELVSQSKKTKKETQTLEQILDAQSVYSQLTDAARAHAKRLHHLPAKEGFMYVNGKRYTFTQTGYRRNLLDIYPQIPPYLQQKMFDGVLDEKTDVYEHFLALPQIRQRVNVFVYESTPRSVAWISLSPALIQQLNNIEYIRMENKEDKAKEDVTLWIVTDFSTVHGLTLIRHAISLLSVVKNVRLALIHSSSDPNSSPQYAEMLFAELLRKPLNGTQWTSILNEIDGLIREPNVAYQSLLVEEHIETYRESTKALLDQLDISPGDTTIIINGRKIGPIKANDAFDVEDFELLVHHEREKRITVIDEYISAVFNQGKDDGLGFNDDYSNRLLRAVVILGQLAQSSFVGDVFDKPGIIQRSNQFPRTMASVGNPLNSLVRIQALIDPMTKTGQKWAPIIEMLAELSGVSVQLSFNTELQLTELPIKQFYRYLIPSRLSFDDNTGDVLPDRITFKDVPKSTLMTMGLDTISAWVAMPTESQHDLDNIRLAKSAQSVDATFTLSHILVEGHVRDITPDNPRGIQLVLNPDQGGTIVMANLGYFQLRAPPGVYNLALRKGRSSEFYHLIRIEDNMWGAFEDEDGDKLLQANKGTDNIANTRVIIDSFEGAVLFPIVKKNPGYEAKELLAPIEKESAEHGIIDSLKDHVPEWLGGHKGKEAAVSPPTPSADINIFSVASGHLYERFLSVMIASVMKHTKSTVKFWFIEDFLSPAFKDFLPHLSTKFEFQYELITYQWPHWLRKQSEKQRKIWGYKILFLDVLFPLDLNKVIFVDADQIVRTDLQTLVDLDLKGAPYGYTPFCSDRKEMDQFRFWNDGYWKNHLRGKPYHISALYVVDLRQFRTMAAGDILRGQYQALSADPNSLANLDQDLPNNLQDDVPIHSLPQEWLWCETWCSDESLAKAKTIDLCNNPLTKEPKLDRARRQLPEWSEYDAEITAFAQQLAGESTKKAKKHDANGDTSSSEDQRDVSSTTASDEHDEL